MVDAGSRRAGEGEEGLREKRSLMPDELHTRAAGVLSVPSRWPGHRIVVVLRELLERGWAERVRGGASYCLEQRPVDRRSARTGGSRRKDLAFGCAGGRTGVFRPRERSLSDRRVLASASEGTYVEEERCLLPKGKSTGEGDGG